jgi:hypothetical protein
MALEGVVGQKSEVKGQKSEFRIQSLSKALADFLTNALALGFKLRLQNLALAFN